jgi:hypothetical protein
MGIYKQSWRMNMMRMAVRRRRRKRAVDSSNTHSCTIYVKVGRRIIQLQQLGPRRIMRLVVAIRMTKMLDKKKEEEEWHRHGGQRRLPPKSLTGLVHINNDLKICQYNSLKTFLYRGIIMSMPILKWMSSGVTRVEQIIVVRLM